jgi:H+-transporting ATPase
VARADGDGSWQLVGILPLFDPPRDDAKETIATALKMGVKIKMVTGDALAIAKETAKKLGMGTNILDATALGDSKKQETDQVAEEIEKADGFAQVFPEHKFHIVDVLQKRGHLVGMTGDGVNDAPALKKADCGIAVSGATDAARAAASIVLTTPGLSVIIDAIKESRRIFQRMNSYAIYRIAETLRVLLFMTAAILVFNFYPLTAVMIVMLALLNDGAILSIAYDNVRYKNAPESWNMRLVLGIATVLGIIGPIAAFGLFYLGDQVFHLSHNELQPMMYLMLSVAGHLTIFLTRTRGPFWSIRPAAILCVATGGTQILATFIAVYGFLMPPLGWKWTGFVWAYALIWALVSDQVKLLAYRLLDPVKVDTASETQSEYKSEAKDGPKPEVKAAPKTDGKDEPNSDSKAEQKSEAKDKPKPAATADPKPETKGSPKPEEKTEPKPEAKDGSKPEAKAETKPDGKDEPKPEAKADPNPDVKAEPKLDGKVDPKPEIKTPSEVTPQLVKRVHELYEELGREEVRAVEDWEKKEQEAHKDASDTAHK